MNLTLDGGSITLIVLGILAVLVLMAAVKTVPQGYNYTIERFGRYTRTHEARAQPDRPVRRWHRPQDQHDGAGAGGAPAGGDHQGQRLGDGQCGDLLPDPRCRGGGLRGGQPAERRAQPHHDQHPHGDGLDGPRRAAEPSRRDQLAAAARGRRGGQPVGHQDHPHRDQGHRSAARTSSSRWAGR